MSVFSIGLTSSTWTGNVDAKEDDMPSLSTLTMAGLRSSESLWGREPNNAIECVWESKSHKIDFKGTSICLDPPSFNTRSRTNSRSSYEKWCSFSIVYAQNETFKGACALDSPWPINYRAYFRTIIEKGHKDSDNEITYNQIGGLNNSMEHNGTKDIVVYQKWEKFQKGGQAVFIASSCHSSLYLLVQLSS